MSKFVFRAGVLTFALQLPLVALAENWRLTATVVSTDGDSWALLSDESQTRRLRTGEVVQGLSRVVEVDNSSITVVSNGQFKKYRLGDVVNCAQCSVTSAQSTVKTEPSLEVATTETTTTFELKSAVAVDWYARSGRARGLRVAPGTNSHWFDGLPLEAGDVLTTINGQSLSERETALALWEELGAQDLLNVELYRSGQSLSLVLDLRLAL